MKYVGQNIIRFNALNKVNGTSKFIQDIKLPGMLFGKIKRSDSPHAKIKNINTTKAKKLKGVVAIITAKDAPGKKYGYGVDRTPFAEEKVKRIGDEIAAVAATSQEVADEAVELIKAELEELPPILDPETALHNSQNLVHSDRKNNLFTEYNYQHGDIEKGLRGSDIVVEGEYLLPYQAHCSLSTSGVIAQWDVSDNLTLYTPTQIPFLCIRDLATAMNILPSQIRVIQPEIGGAFGQRLDVYNYEVIAALLAKKTNKPVKIVFDRAEEFLMDPYRPKTKIKLRTGATRDGKIIFRDADVLIDAGAYISWGATTPLVMIHTISSLYRVENVRYIAKIVYTNNPHIGAMRGFGNPEMTFAIESQMNEIAEKINIDPFDLRIKNANLPGETTPQGSKITSCGFIECLNEARNLIRWDKKKNDQYWREPTKNKKRGIGIASVFHVGGGARIYKSDGCGAIVKIDDFGKVTVVSGATDIGQGVDVVLLQIAAEELQIPLERFTLVNTDTELKPWDVGVHASRTTFIAGNAVMLAAREVKNELLRFASTMLSESVENLKIVSGEIFSTNNPSNKISYDKVARAYHFKNKGNILVGKSFFDPDNEMLDKDFKGNISSTYAFGCQAVEIEVDLQTGKINVLKVVACHDVGKVINPMYAEGQVEGGVMMGLGYALSEEVVLENGRIKNPNFTDYKILGIKDMPEIEIYFHESNDPKGPFGAKGLSEPCCIPTAAAVANALKNATGIRLNNLPLTPEKVLKCLKENKK